MNMKAIFFVIALLFTSLACGANTITDLLAPLPMDDFSDPSSGWGTGTDSFSSVEYANGGLRIIVYDPYSITWSIPSLTSLENIHIDVNVLNQSSDPKAFFGILCNAQGSTESFYYAGVSPDGYYAFVHSQTAQDDVIIKEEFSESVSAAFAGAQPVRLGLDCGAGALTLYVNGQKIDSVIDSTYASGSVGLFAATEEQAAGVNVIFDDFVVTKIGE